MSTQEPDEGWLDREVLPAYPAEVRTLWELRPDISTYVESSFRELFRTEDPGPLAQGERLLAARTAAEASASPALAEAYERESAQAPDSARARVITEFARRLAVEPVVVDSDDYDELRDAGLSEQALVTLTLLVGFVTYQVRALAGLDVLGGAR